MWRLAPTRTPYTETHSPQPRWCENCTCAVTTRGMGQADMEEVVNFLDRSAKIAVSVNREPLERKEGLTKSGEGWYGGI